MSITPEENPLAEQINAALAALIGCVCEHVDPVCACGIIVGEDFMQIDSNDCADDECSQAWIQVTSVYPTTSLGEQVIDPNQDCDTMLGLDILVGVIRCIEVPGPKEFFKQEDLLKYSIQAMRDMTALKKAIMCCEHFPEYVVGSWSPIGPEGDEYGGYWEISVMI